jgi:hypothetical protein
MARETIDVKRVAALILPVGPSFDRRFELANEWTLRNRQLQAMTERGRVRDDHL